MGWLHQVAAAEARGDDELADRWRYAASCLDETCALLGMQAEAAAYRAASSAAGTPPAETPAPPTGGTLSRDGTIRGRIPIAPPATVPAWIDALFPEGDDVQLMPVTPLI